MTTRTRIIILSCWTCLVPVATAAQQSGSTPSETVAVVHERDINGTDHVTEKVVTRRSPTTLGEEVIIETYRPLVYQGRLVLAERTRRVTTITSYGTEIVEGTDETPRSSPHDPMRRVRQTVTTIRPSGADGYVIERQFFERDANGRLVPKETQVERTSRR